MMVIYHQKPGQIDEAIEMFELFIPAFTDNLKEITVQAKDYRRGGRQTDCTTCIKVFQVITCNDYISSTFRET